MVMLRSDSVVVVATLLCLASAFSTRFVMEGEGEAIKTAERETTTPKTEENQASDSIAVKVIPVMTDMFTQTEDLFNMTPLKVVSMIAAQHLLTTVQNIPAAGNTARDTLDMLVNIVRELNKTAQIIRLTAEYVNISGTYITTTLNDYIKTDCPQINVDRQMTNLKKQFLKSINDHVLAAVKELNEKTVQKEIIGNDILISSSYHIVAAFQEMVNQAVAVASEGRDKCPRPPPKVEVTPASDEVMNGTEMKARFTVDVVPEQGKSHKSIKKDQATPKKQDFKSIENVHDEMTIENLNNHQDMTVEVFSPEAIMQNSKKPSNSVEKISVPNGLKIEYVPLKTISLFETPKKEDKNGKWSMAQEKGEKAQNKLDIENTDKELASSNVDSLSNVAWPSSEKILDKMSNRSPNVVNLFELLSSGLNKPLVNQPQGQEDELVQPVCGVDRSSKKFIIFLNDQKREAHNKSYGTNYESSDMETCINFLIHSPSLYSVSAHGNVNNVDLRPR